MLTEVLAKARALPRPEQLRLIQELAAGLERDESIIEPGREYPIWSPDSAFSAASAMLEELRSDQSRQ